jgi:beta-lactamase regulating signal transducer with metallopeptidase domain
MDRGNRAFAAFLGLCLAVFVGIGVAACVLICIVGYRIQRDGFATLTAGGNDVRPALAFLGLVAAGTVAGLWSLRRQSSATRRLQATIEELRLAPDVKLLEAAGRVGVAGRVDLLRADEPFSFTYGLAKPRIAVSSGLADTLSDEELDAVLEHERYHVRNRDPLKLLLARMLAPTLFFVPILRELRSRYVAARELAADRRAFDRQGRRPLAGALYKVTATPAWVQLTPAAAIGGGEALDSRVRQLETGDEPASPPFSRTMLLLSAAGATTLFGVFLVSLFAFGGPAALARLCNG